jgi:hypothetical protein
MAALHEADRRNGFHPAHLLTELGDINLAVRVLHAAPEQIDRMILSCFVLGLSGRKVSERRCRSSVSRSAGQLMRWWQPFHVQPPSGYPEAGIADQPSTKLS